MLQFYNTLSRKIETFKPIKCGKVKMYTCGPTVYNYAHIGNLRTYVFEDILKRVLKFNGYKIKHIMNITDVGHLTDDADEGEDKMEKGARREGKTAWKIARFYEKAFKQDLKDLNILPPNKYPRATKHIKGQIKLIKKLETKGFTYKTSDGIYFDTSKLKGYGKLANLENQKLKAGARVELGEKKNPTDFALWKLSIPKGAHPDLASGSQHYPKRQMEWPSPWGVGFPGWHIECSAMSTKYLGQPFDIHCGGIDHIPVHHTNEIAQSEAAEGKAMANYWLHGEFLIINQGKMAKSEGNFITLQTLKDRGFSPLAYRYFLLQTHYRKQLDFSWEALEAAQNGLNKLYRLARQETGDRGGQETKIKNRFLEYINDDLDMPGALALVWTALKNKEIDLKTLLEFDQVLGLDIRNNLKKTPDQSEENMPEEIQKLATEREQARQNQNWKKSDELRNELQQLGYGVEDTKTGTKLFKI